MKFNPFNITKSPINVKHKDLKRYGDSRFKSKCPECDEGMLLVYRDPQTFKLLANDICIFCGQKFIYTDIDELNKG
jgi:hypothetical protein